MPELSLIEIMQFAMRTILTSKVLVLIILELAILIVYALFKKAVDAKIVKYTSLMASIIVLGFYLTSYVSTIITFANNVSTRLMEFLYFPTTLEFVVVMLLSLVILVITYIRRKGLLLKIINTTVPIIISFLFFSIIEYINNNHIPFDEFSVFTNPTLMSLYELTMAIFVAWIAGLLIYKIDMYIIHKANVEKGIENITSEVIEIPFAENTQEEFIEMPRLRSEVK